MTKAGFAQKEIQIALDVADLQPEGTIYRNAAPAEIIPEIVPVRPAVGAKPAKQKIWRLAHSSRQFAAVRGVL